MTNIENKSVNFDNLVCPVPLRDTPEILLGHGGGGRLTQELIENLFRPAFKNPRSDLDHDGAVLDMGDQRLVMTTDSFVVRPLFFPGGNIGSLAIHGTVNDLAMCGAKPLFLSAGFIIEEGLSMETLARITVSMQQAAQETGIHIVTGDTKIIERHQGENLFINTTGIGILTTQFQSGPKYIESDDVILINGDLGLHGMAVMAQREGLSFESDLESDVAPLWDLVRTTLDAGINIHAMRDLTRGGLVSALVELADSCHLTFKIDEKNILVCDEVRGSCEILGLDPKYVACEGRMIAFIPPDQVDQTLALWKAHPLGEKAVILGQVTKEPTPQVIMRTITGTDRILDMFTGEQLPRIC